LKAAAADSQLADLRESAVSWRHLIYLPQTGGYKAIRELVEKTDISIASLDNKTMQLVTVPIAKAFSTGVKPVYV